MQRFKTPAYLIIILIIFLPFFALAAGPFDYVPMENIPGFEGQATDFYQYISSVYKFGIWAIGIAALLMIAIGGYMYITSAGNNSSMEKAKGVITDAVVGLVLALGAYLLLYVINPDLVKLTRLPVVSAPVAAPVGAPVGAPAGAVVAPAETTSASNCKSGTRCTDCNNCAAVTGISCKESPCYLNTDLLAALKNVRSSVPWRITEPWPPTVNHDSTCHTNGTCADINLLSGTSPADVKVLSDALKNAGISSYTYESNNCAPYTALGVPCHYYATMTSPSFHVNK